MSNEHFISRRGASYLPQAPKFFGVLGNLWHPKENPDGIVNLGLAENVSINCNDGLSLLTSAGLDAERFNRLHQLKRRYQTIGPSILDVLILTD
jgi:hypothetical protein